MSTVDVLPGWAPVTSFYQELLFHAHARPAAGAVLMQGSEISYAQFARDIEHVTRVLAHQGLPPQSRVAVNAGTLYADWLVIIALMRLGHYSVSVGPREAGRMKCAVLVDADPRAHAPGALTIAYDEDWLRGRGESLPPFHDVPLPGDAVGRLILSSGTTGTSKAIIVRFRTMRERWVIGASLSDHHPGTRYFGMLGLVSTGGFSGPLSVWHAGGAVILEKADKDRGAVTIIKGMRPNFLLASTAQLRGVAAEWPQGALPDREMIIQTGGSSLAPSVDEQVRLRLSPHLYIRYGSTECSRMAMTSAAAAQGRPGYVGAPPASSVVEIIDDQGRVLPPGETGRVRSRSVGMASEYLDDPELTARHFIDGWFVPGDLGVMDDQGGLTIVGRSSEIVNLGGVKLAPERVDERLANVPGVTDVACFGMKMEDELERLWIAVVAGEGFHDKVLFETYHKIFPRTGEPSLLVVSEIPRNAMGKPMRAALQEKVKAGIAEGRLRKRG